MTRAELQDLATRQTGNGDWPRHKHGKPGPADAPTFALPAATIAAGSQEALGA